MPQQFVAFKLSDVEYAVDILAVKEIIRRIHITRVPKAPFFVSGVINLRGNVIPVINLHLRLNLPVSTISDISRIVVFNVDDLLVGCTVDEVVEVLTLDDELLEKPQMAEDHNRFIKSIGKINNRIIIVLDLEKTFNFDLY